MGGSSAYHKGGPGHHGGSDKARTLGGAEPEAGSSPDARGLSDMTSGESAGRGKGLGETDSRGGENKGGPAKKQDTQVSASGMPNSRPLQNVFLAPYRGLVHVASFTVRRMQ